MREGLYSRWVALPPVARLGLVALVIAVPTYVLRGLSSSRPSQSLIESSSDEQQPESAGTPSAQEPFKPSRAPQVGKPLLMQDDEPLPTEQSANHASGGERKEHDASLPSRTNQGRDGSSSEPSTTTLPAEAEAPVRKDRGAFDSDAPPSSATPASASAETSDSVDTSILDEVPPGDPNTPIKFAHYRYVLAASSFTTNPSRDTQLEHIAALERLTQAACMGEMMTTLSHTAPPETPLCRAAITRLLTLNPGSTSATCARDGIDSPNCLSADGDTSYYGLPGRDPLAPRVSGKALERFKTLKAGISKQLRVLRGGLIETTPEQKEAARTEAISLVGEALSLACTSAKLFVRERPTVEVQDFSGKKDPYGVSDFLAQQERAKQTPRPQTAYQPMQQVPEREVFEQAPPGVTPTATPFPGIVTGPLGLLYLVSADCSSTISEARSLNATIPQLVCAERGLYSPRCIQALRVLRREGKGKAPVVRPRSSGQGRKGFSEF